VMARTRKVLTPAANGGSSCPALRSTAACNTQACGKNCAAELPLKKVSNGVAVLSGAKFGAAGESVTFKCGTGYIVTGSPKFTCKQHARGGYAFTSLADSSEALVGDNVPRCIAVGFNPVAPPVNGFFTLQPLSSGSSKLYAGCFEGYQLRYAPGQTKVEWVMPPSRSSVTPSFADRPMPTCVPRVAGRRLLEELRA